MKIFVWLILSFIALIFFTTIIPLMYYHFEDRNEIEDSCIGTDTIPKEYTNLLKLSDSCCKTSNERFVFKNTTTHKNTTTYKYRHPVSTLYIDGKYYLQVYKMDDSFNYSLKNVIDESFLDAHSWIYTTYALDKETDMEFLYKAIKPHRPKNIYFDLYGDSTTVLKKNDTIAYYYSKCRNFSIKFNPQDQNDIYGECRSKSFSEVPLELMFLKKGDNLYMLILSDRNAHTDLKQGMLYSLFFK